VSGIWRLFGAPLRVTIPSELGSEDHLLAYLELSTQELKKIWWYRARMYHRFELAKGKGKVRTISAPDDRLKFLQRRITLLLDQLYRVRNPVHGFVVDKSVKTNALAHLRRRFVLNLDIQDFFPSITENRIIGVLQALGIDDRVADIVARLCCNIGHLPQGAPTSPVLSNMICFRLDKQLLQVAKATRCIYTRYADDITFSSHQPMTEVFEGAVPAAGHFSPDLLAPAVRGTFISNGFAINPNKAHYADRHSRRMVTGLKVNELINVDRRYIRNIRAALFSVDTLGLKNAQEKFESKHGDTSDLGAHLGGKIIWLRHIRGRSDPVFRSIALRFNNVFPDRAIAVTPTVAEIRERAVWVVEHYEGKCAQGSAFFLKDVGLVTADHCVKEAMTVDLYHPSKPANKFKATVLNRDEDRDLAVLKHSIPATEYFELERSSKNVAVGDTLSVVGYPEFGPGDPLNIREGKVAALPTKKGLKQIEVGQKISPGMSGGPLLDADNKVVGVNHKGGPDEAKDLAMHIEVLNAWLG